MNNSDKRAMASIHRMSCLIYRLETNPVSPTLHATEWYFKHFSMTGFDHHQRNHIQPFYDRLRQALEQAKLLAFAGWPDRHIIPVCQAEVTRIEKMIEFSQQTVPRILYGASLCSLWGPDPLTPFGQLHSFMERHMWRQN
ncbi:MAG TPA: hypothetical protein VIU12_11315 [Chryseolinea sp.]